MSEVAGLSPWLVAWWFRQASQMGDAFEVDGMSDLETLEEHVRFEIFVLEAHDLNVLGSAAMENEVVSEDPGEKALQVAQSVVYGWPSAESEPVSAKDVGRFPKAFPLEFPMGIADLYDRRTWTVSPAEWVQHMLRLSTGQFVDGRREHRVVWAMVNTVLLAEAAGKGFAVHRSVMKRQGHRLVGASVLTRSELRAMIENEESVRSMVNQVMVIGRDVRWNPRPCR